MLQSIECTKWMFNITVTGGEAHSASFLSVTFQPTYHKIGTNTPPNTYLALNLYYMVNVFNHQMLITGIKSKTNI